LLQKKKRNPLILNIVGIHTKINIKYLKFKQMRPNSKIEFIQN